MNIHPDFRSIKARSLPSNRWVLGFLAGMLAGVNALYARKFKTLLSMEKVTSRDGARVPVIVIKPESLRKPAPALVYCHGGAFVMKHAPQHLENAVRYAREAQCYVVFVDYRLAPKHPFPAGFDDCYAALQWTLAKTVELGIDRRRIAVGGDSAGGALAAGVAQKAAHEDRIELCGQLLIYPVTDAKCNRPSVVNYANVPPFKAADPSALWTMYLGRSPSEGLPPYASPIHGKLAGLAPAYVEICEFDILHDQGLAYARALTENGVDVTVNEVTGGVHGFDLLAAKSEVSKSVVASRIAFLKKIFAV